MKKSVILLITLLFITAISSLILKNLNDSEEFINEVSINSSLTQTLLTITDVKEEIFGYLKNHKDNLETILENISEGIPLSYGSVDMMLMLQSYEPREFNLNELNQTKFIDFLIQNEIEYPDKFYKMANDVNYTNSKQIDDTISSYIEETDDKKIALLRDEFAFFSIDSNNSEVVKCEFDIEVSEVSSKAMYIYDVKNEEVIDFEFSFK